MANKTPFSTTIERGFVILTIYIKPGSFSHLIKLSRDLFGNSKKDVPYDTKKFISQIFICDKYMITNSIDDPLFEYSYLDLSQAQIGQQETVNLFSKGKIQLSLIRG